MSEIYGTFSKAYVEAMRLRLSALEAENKGLRDRLAALEALEKQRAEDEAWGRENVVVTGNASAWIFSRRPETLTYGNSIAAAIRALREKMEARP